MKIENGLFAGIEIPSEQLQPVLDFQNLPRFRADGSQMVYWATHHRTPLFLEKFSPFDGWSVSITSSRGDFTMPDRAYAADGSIVQQPTVSFLAALIKDGKVMAEASSLSTIYGPKAWESGETNARGRLYDALGLSAPLCGDPDATQSGGTSPTPKGASIPLAIPAALPALIPPITEPSPAAMPAAAEQSDPVIPVAAEAMTSKSSSNVTTIEPSVALLAVTPEASGTTHAIGNTVAIDANLIRTIKTQAAARNVIVPEFDSLAEAKDFYKKLLKGELAPQQGAA